jgi:hypothetical protein
MQLKSTLLQTLTFGAAGVASLVLSGDRAQASNLTPGNLVVIRVGDGTATLTNASTAIFLDEYTQAGGFVQTIALPTAVNGSNNPITNSGVATSEGYLNLSVDGHYLTHAGYGVAPGLTAIASTTSTTAPRVVSRIDLSGNVDTSTILSGDTSYSANNIRSAITNDGMEFWTAGTAGANADGGVRYIAALGANTSVQVSSTVTNTRVIGIFSNQLYTSSASGSFKGINQVGTGLPTTSGNTITLLSGFPSATPSQYDYYFADANTLYVAEDGSNGATGGIEKWTQSAGTWTRQYTLTEGTGFGCRGVTGVVLAGTTTLFATSTETNANQIVTVTDAGMGSAFTSLATASANEVFRGIRLLGQSGEPGVPECRPGIDFATNCPCAGPPPNNPTTAGAGCNALTNPGPTQTGGARLSSAGTSSLAGTTPGVNTLQLTVNGLPTNATESAFLIAGPTLAAPLPFGQGLRCVSGSLKRLQIHSPAPGTSTWPQAGDFAPTIQARHAMLGDPLVAGSIRHYFVEYRQTIFEPGCALPSNFNASNAEMVTWAP